MLIKMNLPDGGLMKGCDHKLDYQMTWEDGTHPNLSTDIAVMTVTISDSDDGEAIIELNSDDNADQFIIRTASTGEGTLWIKAADQTNIVAGTERYVFKFLVTLTDGTTWPFIKVNNLIFTN